MTLDLRRGVLDSYTKGEKIVPLLSKQSLVIPRFGEELGSGGGGVVLKVSSDTVGKRFRDVTLKIRNRGNITVEEFGKSRRSVDEKIFLSLNGDLKSKPEYFIVPEYKKNCLLKSDYTYRSNVDGSNLTIPKPIYLCTTDQYSEHIISSLLSKDCEEGKCINFIRNKGMITTGKRFPNQYILYEMIEKRIFDELEKGEFFSSDDIIESIYIQSLFAIAFYQNKYKISHNDLHFGNIFLNRCREEGYIHYRVFGIDYYVKNVGWLVKVGDFGEAVKFSPPVIGPLQSLGNKKVVPNSYYPSYDLLTLAMNFSHYEVINDFTESIEEYLIGDKEITFHPDYFSRPALSVLKNIKMTALDILTSMRVMGKFTKVPEIRYTTFGVIE